MMRLLPGKVSDQVYGRLMSNFNIQGVQQMGREEIISVLNTTLSQWHESHRVITMQSNDNLEDNNSNTNHTILIEEKEYQYWVWGGKFRPVPEDFEFPTNQSSLKGVMDLYFAGIPAKRIRPFRLIKAATLR